MRSSSWPEIWSAPLRLTLISDSLSQWICRIPLAFPHKSCGNLWRVSLLPLLLVRFFYLQAIKNRFAILFPASKANSNLRLGSTKCFSRTIIIYDIVPIHIINLELGDIFKRHLVRRIIMQIFRVDNTFTLLHCKFSEWRGWILRRISWCGVRLELLT